MYKAGRGQRKYHLAKYGHPSQFGFKDDINAWKADPWNPGELVALYKEGGKYFLAQAKLTGQDVNEGRIQLTSVGVRFNTKGDVRYATVMEWPDNKTVTIKNLAQGITNYCSKAINKVEWLGGK